MGLAVCRGEIREVLCSTVHTVVMCVDYRGEIREVLCSTVHTVVMCVDYRGADQRGSLFYCTYSCHVCGL